MFFMHKNILNILTSVTIIAKIYRLNVNHLMFIRSGHFLFSRLYISLKVIVSHTCLKWPLSVVEIHCLDRENKEHDVLTFMIILDFFKKSSSLLRLLLSRCCFLSYLLDPVLYWNSLMSCGRILLRWHVPLVQLGIAPVC